MIRTLALATVVVGLTAAVSAQQARPTVNLPASPRGSAAIQVLGKTVDGKYTGGQWITVDYGRPIMRGRANIFGAGANYGKTVNPDAPIWRAGANDSTKLTTQAALTIGGTTVQPGVYNVFIELKEGAWTLVLNTQPHQPKYDPNEKVLLYGSYNYDSKFDVLRAPMKVTANTMSVEQLTIGFADVRTDGGTLYLAWDKTIGSVAFTAK